MEPMVTAISLHDGNPFGNAMFPDLPNPYGSFPGERARDAPQLVCALMAS